MKPLDLITAIETAYDRSKDDRAWLEDIARIAAPGFSAGDATSCYFFDVVGEEGIVGETVSVGGEPYSRTHFVKQHEVGHQQQPSRVVYDCDMYTLLSRVVGKELAASSIRAAGMSGEDAVGLRANITSDSGIIITTQVGAGHRLRDRNLWMRFAAHVGAGGRLRRIHRRTGPDAAPAVLSPTGELEHGSADAIAAREDLGQAAKDMDRARGTMRRIDADAASALWRAMVRGQWTLVDWLDHDGKRFLLAQENHLPTSPRRDLTEREQQVVACAAMGHSNKLIAYDLGISTGTVSVLLARAARKLGVTSRIELIRVFRESKEHR